jgi:hypothetical protein
MYPQHFYDNAIPVLCPGYPVIFPHSDKQPFCPDSDCPCKENKEAIGWVNQFYQEGLITKREAKDIIMGRRPL